MNRSLQTWNHEARMPGLVLPRLHSIVYSVRHITGALSLPTCMLDWLGDWFRGNLSGRKQGNVLFIDTQRVEMCLKIIFSRSVSVPRSWLPAILFKQETKLAMAGPSGVSENSIKLDPDIDKDNSVVLDVGVSKYWPLFFHFFLWHYCLHKYI